MQAWNASMGGVTTEQAGTAANVANQNAQNVYENALAKRDALKEASQYARDEDRWQYESALSEAELKLRMAAEQRDATYQQWQMDNPRGGDTVGDAVLEGIKRGYLPGVNLETARAEVESELDPDGTKRFQDPQGFNDAVQRKLYSDFMSQFGGGGA